jgi:hypothetical protein
MRASLIAGGYSPAAVDAMLPAAAPASTRNPVELLNNRQPNSFGQAGGPLDRRPERGRKGGPVGEDDPLLGAEMTVGRRRTDRGLGADVSDGALVNPLL